MSKKLSGLSLIFLVLAFSACSGAGFGATPTPEPTPTEIPCIEQSADLVTSIDSIMERWEDADELAAGTARIALSGPVGTLQEVRREVTALAAPPCSESIKESLAVYMDTQIDSYLSFMTDDDDTVEQAILLASMYELAFTDIYTALKDGDSINGRVAYFVTGNRLRLNVTLNGETLEDESTPWFDFGNVEPGETVTVSALTTSNSSSTINCLIFSAGEVIASNSANGFAANTTCTGTAK